MIRVDPELVERTLGELRRCGDGRTECVVYWVADLRDPGVVIDVIHPPHEAGHGWYEVEREWPTGFFIGLADLGRAAVGQVHSHPGSWVEHSGTDDRYVLVPSPGFVSIVAPDFGADQDLSRSGVFVLQADGSWLADQGAVPTIARSAALSRTLDLLSELLASASRSAIDGALGSARVRVEVDEHALSGREAQAAAYALAILVVRSGMRLSADLPVVERLVDLPGLDGSEFGQALNGAVRRMFPGASVETAPSPDDIAVALGGAPASGRVVLRLGCRDREAHVRRSACEMRWRPMGVLPALAAAGLAVSEVIKDVLRPLAGPETAELLEPLEPTFVVPPIPGAVIDLGRVEVISAGAITQNLFLVLAADDRVRGAFEVFDRDRIELSNANRCPFVLIDEVGWLKVDALADHSPRRLAIRRVGHHIDERTLAEIPAGSVVVVGADDIAARHLAQRTRPAWLGVGATSHFFALVTEHGPGQACAGCAHPDLGESMAVIPTISIVSFWAGFLLGLRLLAHGARANHPADRQVTNFWPLRPDSLIEHALRTNPRCPLDHPAGRREP